MPSQRVNITTPVGRIVEGSLYKPNTTNFDGKPLTVSSGANAGKPRVDYFIAIAIPKGAEQSWAQTAWGLKIYQVGAAAFPAAIQRPDFSWKIVDGDSTIPNKKNTRPCDKEGYPGNWVLRLSGGFAPKIYRQEGGALVQVLEPDYVKPGHFIEAAISVDSNDNQNNPGVYLNHSMICHRGYGPEIVFGPSPEDAGFGAAPLPAGASMVPLASSVPPLAAAPPPTGVVAAALPSPGAPAVPPIPVTPNPGFLQVGGVPNPTATLPAVTAPPPPPPPAPVPVPPSSPQMTAAAKGVSYQAYIAAGWTDETLRSNGLLA